MNKLAPCFVVPMMLVASFVFPQTSSIQLSILQPENGAVVSRRQCGGRDLESCEGDALNVTGTSAGLGANTIVLFVYSPPAERWFFQGEATVERDGSWEVRDIMEFECLFVKFSRRGFINRLGGRDLKHKRTVAIEENAANRHQRSRKVLRADE